MTADTADWAGIRSVVDDTICMYYHALGAMSRLAARLRTSLAPIGRLGFGRSGALAVTRRMFPVSAITPLRRAVSLLVGSLLVGTGVALLTQADLGLSPYDVLVSGLQPRLGLSFGQTVWAVSGAIFVVAAMLGQRPSRWGIAYVGSIGFAVDAVSGSINGPESLFGRGLFVAAALFTLAGGISLVVHSGSTGGGFELLMEAGEVRGYDRRVVRTSLEVGVLVIGIVLGGRVGVATLIVALGIGPLLGVTGQALADHSDGRASRLIERSPHSQHPRILSRHS